MLMVDQHRVSSNPMFPCRREFFARLRAHDMDELHKHEPRDVIPFPGVTTVRPSRPSRVSHSQRLPHLSEDSIAAAEEAVAQFERRLQNLRKLLGEEGPDDGPRAA